MPNSTATLERLKSNNCQDHLWKYLQLRNAARHGSCQKPNRQVYYAERIGMQKLIMHLSLQTVSPAEPGYVHTLQPFRLITSFHGDELKCPRLPRTTIHLLFCQ